MNTGTQWPLSYITNQYQQNDENPRLHVMCFFHMERPWVPDSEAESLAQCASACVHELSDVLQTLKLGSQKSSIGFLGWDSDFHHGANWSVCPIYIRDSRGELAVPPLFCSYINRGFQRNYSLTYNALCPWIEEKKINYIAFSCLGPKQCLKAHSHLKPSDSAKVIIPIENYSMSGMMHSCCNPGGKIAKSIVHWDSLGQYVIFDDRYLHSAWNMSNQSRYVVIIDFEC
jgi:hypothetical protein